MRLTILFLVWVINTAYAQKLNYPYTPKSDRIDVYHGVEVADPYQWLENETSDEVKHWIKQQNELTYKYLEQIPYRQKIKNRLAEVWTFETMSAPIKKAGKIFYYRHNGQQNHPVYYYKNDNNDKEYELINPNNFSADGTTSLTNYSISNNGKYVAYAVSHKGSDWNEIYIKEIETGRLLSEKLEWVKFSGIAWYKNGFFYSRYPAPADGNIYSAKNEFHKVYYHKLNTPQSNDLLIYEDKNYALRNFGVSITSDEKFAILTTSQGTSGNLLALADVSKWDVKSPIQFNLFNKDFSADYWYVGQIKSGLLFITNHQAPNKKLVLINPKKNKPDVWQVLIPESDHVLENVYVTKSGLIVKYMIDVRSALFVYNFSGKREQEIQLPVTGNIISVQTTPDKDEFYYSIVSYTFPARIYKSSVNHLKSELYFKPAIKFDSDNFVTKQVFYYSKDSTKIPMFITHRKDLQLNGDNPCFLFGYGGFNISYTPEFRVDRSVFLENGGIYCVANIRGGGEYGKRWHNAGRQLNKQNVFNDFIAAAEYLIKEKYTNTHKLAIHGRSNGGLLAAACLTQRPDLFKVVIPQVGVLDMLKFHKFTIGWAWVGDYGSSENKEHFEYLLKYSPVHNVKPNHYPATLVVTADHDDRVVPAHSYKFIAQLQDKQLSDNPALIRIDTNGGHGSGKPLAMQIDEYGDMWSFVFYNLGMSIN